MGKLFGVIRKMVKYTDDRVRLTNEALQGIQGVKMYAWEDSFSKEIYKTRNDEVNLLGQLATLRGFSRAYMSSLPGLVAVVSFTMYATVKNETVKASTLFAALIAFEQLRFPLLFYPMALATLAQAKVSAVRVGSFLKMKEIIPVHLNQTTKDSDKKISNMEGVDIDIQDATIYWSDVIPIQQKADVKVEMDVNELTTNNLDIDHGTYNVEISPQLE